MVSSFASSTRFKHGTDTPWRGKGQGCKPQQDVEHSDAGRSTLLEECCKAVQSSQPKESRRYNKQMIHALSTKGEQELVLKVCWEDVSMIPTVCTEMQIMESLSLKPNIQSPSNEIFRQLRPEVSAFIFVVCSPPKPRTKLAHSLDILGANRVCSNGRLEILPHFNRLVNS